MAIKTQGTHLFFIDPVAQAVMAVGCVTSISGITAARDQIETTCLESDARTYEAGMATPGAATFGINFDPKDPSHLRLHQLYVAGTSLKFAVGWSDGTSVPTIDTGGDFDLPPDRSWIGMGGYVSDLPFEFALSAVVTSTVSIQISDFPVVVPKSSS